MIEYKKYCQKWVDQQGSLYGRKVSCGRQATHVDAHGRNLCERHYNKWKKKVDQRMATINKQS